MLRLENNDGWTIVTHPDHAHLAGQFASAWGNELFASTEPRAHVLRGIYAHDDGWAARDAQPVITREGKPAAFSTELVGAYSAFEEIDLAAYLAVRREAVQLIAREDPYAAILISMHTYNLLSARADRNTIRPDYLPWLDAFLVEQLTLQRALRDQLLAERTLGEDVLSPEKLNSNFRLLQACDNLSLLACVDYAGPATLLWPLPLRDGSSSEVSVQHIAPQTFRLAPYPFVTPQLTCKLRSRYIPGKVFASSQELQQKFSAAIPQETTIRITA